MKTKHLCLTLSFVLLVVISCNRTHNKPAYSNNLQIVSQDKPNEKAIDSLLVELKNLRMREDTIIKSLITYRDFIRDDCNRVSNIAYDVIESNPPFVFEFLMENMEVETLGSNYGDECMIFFNVLSKVLGDDLKNLELTLNKKAFDKEQLQGISYALMKNLGEESKKLYLKDVLNKTSIYDTLKQENINRILEY